MHKVIDAAIENDVAIEINNRYKIPSAPSSKPPRPRAQSSPSAPTMPTPNLGRLEYPIQMVRECGLKWQDIFVPRPAGQRKIQAAK